MPLTDAQRQKRRYARQKVIRDLARAQANGIHDPDERRQQILSIVTGRMALPTSDAEWFWNTMQRTGWRFSGFPITDTEGTLDIFQKNQFFPSQRK